jgi:hypothetical protein
MAMAEPGQVVVLHASRMLDVRAMATMKPKGIFAVPTVAILQYYVARRRLLGWEGKIGELKPGMWSDVISVDGK